MWVGGLRTPCQQFAFNSLTHSAICDNHLSRVCTCVRECQRDTTTVFPLAGVNAQVAATAAVARCCNAAPATCNSAISDGSVQ